MAKPWIARRFQLHGFKGRAKRALLWTKKTYEEWFNYALLAEKLPIEFGQVSKFKNFEEWWRHPSYGFELFCEPEMKEPIEEIDLSTFKASSNQLFVALNLEQPADKILFNIKNLLSRKQPKLKDYKPQAKFIPSKEPKRIQLEKIKRYRLALTLQKEGYVRREIAQKLSTKGLYGFRKNGEPQYPDLLEVTRDIRNAKKILRNVERGKFP